MSFTISNVIYAKQGKLDNTFFNKSNLITSVVDIVLIATASVIGGLMLDGKLTFGLKDLRTIRIIAWSSIALGVGVALADIITAIVVLKHLQWKFGTTEATNFKLDIKRNIDEQIMRIDFGDTWTDRVPPSGDCTITFVNGQQVQGSISGVDAHVLIQALPNKCFYSGTTEPVPFERYKSWDPETWGSFGRGTALQVLEAFAKNGK